MKAYVTTTGVLFGLLTVAHLWRMFSAEPEMARDPWYILITLAAAALCLWALSLLPALGAVLNGAEPVRRVMVEIRRGRLVPLVLLIASVSGGCHAAVQPELPVALTVDSAAYHRLGQSPVTVPFAVSNNGPTPVRVAQCDGRPVAVVDRWGVGGWRFLEGGFCNGSAPAPLELAAGASAHGVVILYDGGAYRLRVNWIAATPGSHEGTGASKSFEVW